MVQGGGEVARRAAPVAVRAEAVVGAAREGCSEQRASVALEGQRLTQPHRLKKVYRFLK